MLRGSALLALGVALVLASCGIKGPPKPRGVPADSAPALYRAAGATRAGGRVVLAWALPAAVFTESAKKLLVERHEAHDGSDGPSCGKRTIVGRVARTLRIEWSYEAMDPSQKKGVTYRLVADDGTPLSDSIETTATLK